jgi:hypothetical protein
MSAGVDDRPLERLLTALPSGIRRLLTRVLHPQASWVRRPLGVIMVVGGLCAYSGEVDRPFRRNVTGDSAESAL